MASISRFVPLEGVPDADLRGAGTFHFDDGTSMVSEDAELADLVRSYQDTLPQMEASMPDQRLASLDPSTLGAEAFGASATPEQAADFLQNAKAAPTPYDAPLAYPPTPNLTGGHVAPDTGSHAAETTALAGAPSVGQAPAPLAGGLPPPPSDADQAANLHRMAGQQALQGHYVTPQAAGYSPAQRTGALDPAVAARQAQERQGANQGVLDTTEQARMQEAEALRKSALDEAMRLSVQKAEQQRQVDEANAKRQRLIEERRKVNDAEIDTSFAQGNGFRQAMALLGSALLGATGSDAGLRMIESNIDQHVRKEMQIRGSKLNALADELGSEEQAIAAGKAKLYDLVGKEAANAGKLYDAAKIEHSTPAILAGLKQQMQANEQEQERQSLGKTVETYHQARAGGRTGPNFGEAAKHYEAADKLTPHDLAKATEGLERGEVPDFIARMEGLADGEHELNEMDQNIGIQRDAAGNVTNEKDLGNIEGAGFFGGRTPDEYTSQKGAALARSQRRLTRAAVKATSGASATDSEYERISKDVPLTDEKDLVNATTEQRRIWQKNYSKAVSLYGKDRVEKFLGGYRGNRAQINAQRGRPEASGSARGRVLQVDGDS